MIKNYNVIEESTIVNLKNEVVETLSVGSELTGEFVLIDEEPYVETESGYVSTKGLAEKLGGADEDIDLTETKVKASHAKIVYALVGAGAGFAIAHFAMKLDTKKKILFTVGGLAFGLAAEYMNSRKKGI